MKRLVAVLVTVLVLYCIYYDLSHGTLPVVKTDNKNLKLKQWTLGNMRLF